MTQYNTDNTTEQNMQGVEAKASVLVFPRQGIERKIGFDAVRAMVVGRCSSPQARTLALETMQWSADAGEVRCRLARVAEMVKALTGDDILDLGTVEDLQRPLKSISVPGTFVEASELLTLLKALRQAMRVRSWLDRKSVV